MQTDVVHSQAFKEYCGNFVREPDHRNIVLMLYADGVSVATRRDSSMFVISAQVVNLPPDKRRLRDNILLLQIIPGPKTPSNISGLLQPLVDELHRLYTVGVQIAIGNGETITIKAMFITIVADCRAHPKLTMMMQTPAEYPCHLCELRVDTRTHTRTRTPTTDETAPCSPRACCADAAVIRVTRRSRRRKSGRPARQRSVSRASASAIHRATLPSRERRRSRGWS